MQNAWAQVPTLQPPTWRINEMGKRGQMQVGLHNPTEPPSHPNYRVKTATQPLASFQAAYPQADKP